MYKNQSLRITILSLLTLGIYLFWFAYGYHVPLNSDTIKEVTRIMNFNFPNNIFEKANWDSNIWHISRWSINIISFLSFNVIGKLWSFFTGNIIQGLYVAHGTYIGFVFLMFSVVITFYTKLICNFRLLSYKFMFVLFITGSFFIFTQNDFAKIIPHVFRMANPSFILNYIWSTSLLLIVLYPYWEFLVHGKWKERSPVFNIIWFWGIIFASFSGVGLILFFFCIQFFILSILTGSRFIPSYSNIFFHTPKIVYKALFFGIVISSISFSAETFNGMYIPNNTESYISSLFNNLIPIIKHYIIFILLFSPNFIILLFYRQNYDIQEFHKYTRAYLMLFCLMLGYLTLLFVGKSPTGVPTLYYAPAYILICLAYTISLVNFLSNIPSPIILSLILMIVLSRYLDMIKFDTSSQRISEVHNYLLFLSDKNKQLNGSKIIYAPAIESSKWFPDQWYTDIYTKLAQQTGIIDPDVKVIVQSNKK